jgi:hypothetical protein
LTSYSIWVTKWWSLKWMNTAPEEPKRARTRGCSTWVRWWEVHRLWRINPDAYKSVGKNASHEERMRELVKRWTTSETIGWCDWYRRVVDVLVHAHVLRWRRQDSETCLKRSCATNYKHKTSMYYLFLLGSAFTIENDHWCRSLDLCRSCVAPARHVAIISSYRICMQNTNKYGTPTRVSYSWIIQSWHQPPIWCKCLARRQHCCVLTLVIKCDLNLISQIWEMNNILWHNQVVAKVAKHVVFLLVHLVVETTSPEIYNLGRIVFIHCVCHFRITLLPLKVDRRLDSVNKVSHFLVVVSYIQPML